MSTCKQLLARIHEIRTELARLQYESADMQQEIDAIRAANPFAPETKEVVAQRAEPTKRKRRGTGALCQNKRTCTRGHTSAAQVVQR